MATINFGADVSLAEAAQLIVTVPEAKFNLEGEPGIGKSSLLNSIAKLLPTHNMVYRDCQTMDLGDIAMPMPNRETKATDYYPSAGFRLNEGKPVVIMLDEFSKAMQPVQNMLHPMLEAVNPRLGDVPLPAGSIVFMTGNLATDGVGDTTKAHTRNRVTTVRVAKPDADQWLGWAQGNGVEPVVCAWVKQFPHALASYTDAGQKENPYIYDPKKQQRSFVTPRSLERASHIIRQRDRNSQGAIISALTGTIGEAASRDMAAFIDYQDQLPSWASILDNPKGARLPDSPGACAVLVYGAVSKVTKETMEPVMQYLKRFEAEWQAVFAVSLARSANQEIAFHSKAFSEWLRENSDIL
jgi:hypothetical protein